MPNRKIQLARILHNSAKIYFAVAGDLNLPGGLQQQFTFFPLELGLILAVAGGEGEVFFLLCVYAFLLFLISVL